MGQLSTLLWKNFKWCRRHWLKTCSFYVFPLALCGFLLLIVRLIPIKDNADCSFREVALPPSHPAFLVQSLVCGTKVECANRTKG